MIFFLTISSTFDNTVSKIIFLILWQKIPFDGKRNNEPTEISFFEDGVGKCIMTIHCYGIMFADRTLELLTKEKRVSFKRKREGFYSRSVRL